ncbi:MAG TPA: HypC/HybG/HupF family hydrogenase formation chaperone [Methylocystis sp.]|nr:HypC/HybG/HupF family hydrogenase formation chaperone [Methylocystis sp.]
MCIGFPMTVVEDIGAEALCERRGERERISMLLVGPQPKGTKVLAHLGAAVRVLGDLEAQQIDDALDAVEAALRGENVDHLFADLIDRVPQLPEFLAGEPAP